MENMYYQEKDEVVDQSLLEDGRASQPVWHLILCWQKLYAGIKLTMQCPAE